MSAKCQEQTSFNHPLGTPGQRGTVRRGKVDACYKSLILPNFDAKWTGQEFAGLFDRSFITVSMNCVTAIDVSRVLHEHAIS
jgi:hypothetical protein